MGCPHFSKKCLRVECGFRNRVRIRVRGWVIHLLKNLWLVLIKIEMRTVVCVLLSCSGMYRAVAGMCGGYLLDISCYCLKGFIAVVASETPGVSGLSPSLSQHFQYHTIHSHNPLSAGVSISFLCFLYFGIQSPCFPSSSSSG